MLGSCNNVRTIVVVEIRNEHVVSASPVVFEQVPLAVWNPGDVVGLIVPELRHPHGRHAVGIAIIIHVSVIFVPWRRNANKHVIVLFHVT